MKKIIEIFVFGFIICFSPEYALADCFGCNIVLKVEINYKNASSFVGYANINGSHSSFFHEGSTRDLTGTDILPLLLMDTFNLQLQFAPTMYKHKQGLPALFAKEEVRSLDFKSCKSIFLLNHFNYSVNGSGTFGTFSKSDIEIIMNNTIVDTTLILGETADYLFVNLSESIDKSELDALALYFSKNIYSHYIYGLKDYFSSEEKGKEGKSVASNVLQEKLHMILINIDSVFAFWSKPSKSSIINRYNQYKIDEFSLMKKTYQAFYLMMLANDPKYFSEVFDYPIDKNTLQKIKAIHESKYSGDIVERVFALNNALNCSPDPYDMTDFYKLLSSEKIYLITLGWD
jgi:hypothetical protein